MVLSDGYCRQEGGSCRSRVDNRKLNAVTQLDAYRMLRIDKMLDQIGQSRYLTTLDLELAKGYWQVPTEPADN